MHSEAIILRKSRNASASTPKMRRSLAIDVRATPLDRRKGILKAGGMTLRCALGKGGVSARKREGDGATPLAVVKPLALYFRRNCKVSGVWQSTLLKIPIRADEGWCDAPGDPRYNRPVKLPYHASHEKMMRDDRLYNVCIVLDWNMYPRLWSRGSAIFMHIARPGLKPTEGCIALEPRDMRRLLPFLNCRTRIRILR